MNHKRYPLAYLLEVVMPLNLVTIRDEAPDDNSRKNQNNSDWVMAFDAGKGKMVTINYYHQKKNPFEFQWKGFDWHPYHCDNELQMIQVMSVNLWDAIQVFRALDSLANNKATALV